jgi:hypothetical protein
MWAKITRREWAAALGVTAAAAQAQTQPAADLMAEARSEVRQDIEQLVKFPLPPAAEPAFVFKP